MSQSQFQLQPLQLKSPGTGYSNDTGQIVRFRCYDTIPLVSGVVGRIYASDALYDSEFHKIVHKNTGGSIKWGLFKGSASYMRTTTHTTQHSHYSFSLNYFHIAKAEVSVGEAELNDFGRRRYNDGKNPLFGIICGSHYIDSYVVGALLLMTIKIDFNSQSDQQAFASRGSAKVGWRDLFSVMQEVSGFTRTRQTSGSVSIYAEQIGGDPAQLGKILGKDNRYDYHMVKCSLNAIDQCTSAASELLKYGSRSFSEQVSFETGKGLEPLGIDFITYRPISWIGLEMPRTLVTPEVVAARDELVALLQENQYYAGKFDRLLHAYPVAWDEGSAIYKSLTSLNRRVEHNLAVLQDSDPEKGGVGCFDLPHECLEIARNIKEQLVPVVADDLAVFEPLMYRYEWRVGAVETRGTPFQMSATEKYVGLYYNGTGYNFHCNANAFFTCSGAYVHSAVFEPTVLQIDYYADGQRKGLGNNFKSADNGSSYKHSYYFCTDFYYATLGNGIWTCEDSSLPRAYRVHNYHDHLFRHVKKPPQTEYHRTEAIVKHANIDFYVEVYSPPEALKPSHATSTGDASNMQQGEAEHKSPLAGEGAASKSSS